MEICSQLRTRPRTNAAHHCQNREEERELRWVQLGIPNKRNHVRNVCHPVCNMVIENCAVMPNGFTSKQRLGE